MLIHKYIKDITVSSGSGEDTTLKYSGALIYQIFLKATSTTNVFDFKITDEDDDTIFSANAVEGSYEDATLTVPLRGKIKVVISSASADEDIRVKLMIQE